MRSRNLPNRRSVLLVGAAVALGGLPLRAYAKVESPSRRTIAFHNLHTGDRLRTTYWADGHYLSPALKDIDFVLRDFRTGDVASIDPRLLDLLHLLRSRMESGEPFHVISGYRSPKTNATLAQQSGGVAKKSLHMRGMAADVRLPGRMLSDLRRAAVSLKLGGVGYYPKSDFVHVDIGRVRYW
jgi:uncharacterized protein YcbK (DUF882 family)